MIGNTTEPHTATVGSCAATVGSARRADRDCWRKVKIGSLGRVVTGKTPPTADAENFGGEYPFITPGDMHQGRCAITTTRYVSDKGAFTVKNSRIPKGSVCVSCIGSDMGNVVYTNRESFTNQQINSIICCDEVDSLFVYYLMLTQKDIIKGIGTAGGSAVPIMSKSEFCDLDVDLPPLSIQRKIASVLGAYDDLIENNRRRIALLEKMARELYRERFMRRAGGRGLVSINDVCAIQYGYAFNAKMFNASGNGFPIVRIRNIQSGISSDYTTEHVSDAYVVHNGDVLVGMDGEFHINMWSGGDAYLVQRCCCFRPYDESQKGYLMEAIRSPIKYFEKSAMGATVGHLGKKDIDTIRVAVPTSAEKALFRSVFDERLSLSLQNRYLARQRDRFLPRLMSGKIDLDKLSKEGV